MKQLLFFTICLSGLFSLAQQPVSIQLLEKDGLPTNEFYSVLEDKNGFIWLAGDKGITKYDGKKFNTLSHPEKKGLSLFGAKLDQQGRIWCINLYGQLFYVENDQLHLETDFNKEFNGGLADFDVLDNKIVLSTHYTRIIYDFKTKDYTQSSINSRFSYTIPKTYNDKVYTGFNDSLTVITSRGLSSQKYDLVYNPELFNHEFDVIHNKIIPYHENKILLNSHVLEKQNKLSIWNIENDVVQKLKVPKALVNRRQINHYFVENKLWILTDNGIYITTIIDQSIIIEQHLFKGKRVSDLLVDRDQNYWITTTENGVYIIPNIHINEIKLPQNLESPTDIKLVDDQLFIGTTSGKLFEYHLSTAQSVIKDFKKTRTLKKIFYNPYEDNLIINHESTSLVYDFNKDTTRQLPIIANMKDFIFYETGEVLYASSSKVNKLSSIKIHDLKNKKEFKKLSNFTLLGRGYKVFYDSINKSEYFGNINGFYRMYGNKVTDTIKTTEGKPLFSKDMAQTSNGKLWLSTFTKGVYEIKKDHSTISLKEMVNFTSNRTGVIKADGIILWITTNEGFYKFNTETYQLQKLKKSDGILSYNVNNIAVGDHSIFISSDEGIFEVDKTLAFKDHSPAQLFIEKVTIDNKSIEGFTSIRLKESSALKVDFIAPGFKFLESGNFQYRFLGLDKTWNTLESGSRSIQLASIPHGDFKLQIRSEDALNMEGAITLPISVILPFYKSFWIWGLGSLIIISAIVLYYRRLLRFRESEKNKQLKQLEINTELVNLKLENLRSQMNPHFIFNALNSIQDYIVDNEKKLASNFLSKFADLIRTYLNQSLKGTISLKEEITTLHKYLELEKLRFEDHLIYSISDYTKSETDEIMIPTMLIQPYVENSLKHGLLHLKNGRELSISFELAHNSILKCTIIDNGVGRTAAKEIQSRKWKKHESFAATATKNRLELLNYGKSKKAGVEIIDLFNDSHPTGTKVIVKIPYNNSF